MERLFLGHKTNSKHFLWYKAIITRAKSQARKKLKPSDENFIYYECHHILPKSMGGSNKQENIVLLTAKEHFVAHHLLYEFCVGLEEHKMAIAWRRMSTDFRNGKPRYVNARLFDKAKQAAAVSLSILNSKPNHKLKSRLRDISKYGKVNFLFYNVETKEHFFGTKFELIDNYDISHPEVDLIIKNPNRCCKNWMVQTSDVPPQRSSMKGIKNPSADKNVYDFFHVPSKTAFRGTRIELMERFPQLDLTAVGLSEIIKGRTKSHRGIVLGTSGTLAKENTSKKGITSNLV